MKKPIIAKPPCTVPSCTRTTHCRGYCEAHYRRLREWGDPRPDVPLQQQGYRHGMTLDEKFLDLWRESKGLPGACWPWKGPLDRDGYGYCRKHRQGIRKAAHRMAYEAVHGEIPDDHVIDHTCRNRACVNPDHLRLATLKQNAENQALRSTRARSGFRGVHWRSVTGKWEAKVKHNGVYHSAGTYDTVAEALAAVQQLRATLHTHNEVDRRIA